VKSITVAIAICALASPARAQQAPVLAREQILIAGVALTVPQDHQTVPRNIATAVAVQLVATGDTTGSADATSAIPSDALLQAELRGPAFGAPVTIVARPGDPLKIQPLAVVGTYVLENIRLVSGGVTFLQATPDTVTIDVIDKVLVSQVTTRQLTAAEIQQKGIFVDQTNFDVVNFTAAFGIQGSQQTIDFPMILPKRASSGLPASAPTPSLPPLSLAAVLPPPNTLPQLQQVFQTNNIGISGLTLKIDDDEVASQFTIPPIPGVIVIPGNIAFLHQFFSVLLMVSNVAPGGSNLSVRDATATIVLPPGADTVAGSDDDPLRMARIGNPPVAQDATQPVAQPGPDGKVGTADDIGTLAPGDNGNSEFLVEGRKEGTHTVQIQINAILDGLPIGPVKISGSATGVVEVRNPTFSLTLSHPATVTAGEDYDLLVTVTNTSDSIANLVSVNLSPNSISGAVLKSDQSVTLNSIAARDAATATFHLTSQVTGNVTATSFTSDDAPGAFVLRTAVGALGIPLSPNSLVLPAAANALPADVRTAAVGLLGQAYALATSPVVPVGLQPITQQIVFERVTDVARAGQRLGMHDTLVRAVEDLTLDLAGNGFTRLAERFPDDPDSQQHAEADYRGFDNLFRQSVRATSLLAAIAPILGADVQTQGALGFQNAWAQADASGAPFLSVVTGAGGGAAPIVLHMSGPAGDVGQRAAGGPIARNLVFTNFLTLVDSAPDASQLVLDAAPAAGNYTVDVTGTANGTFDLGLTLPDGDHLRHVTFSQVPIALGARGTVTFTLGGLSAITLTIDDDGDGVSDRTVQPTIDEAIADFGPTLVSAVQVVTGMPDPSQFGEVVGLLFSEEVTTASSQTDAATITNYHVDGNQVLGASLQTGGRVLLLSLRDGVGPFVARTVTVAGLEDRLAHPMSPSTTTVPIAMTISDQGVSLAGQVRGADGRPIARARLQLSQSAPVPVAAGALAGLGDLAAVKEVAVTVKDLDASGRYSFDYVRRFGFTNESIRLTAIDLDTSDSAEVSTQITRPGQHLDVDVVFIGSGTLVGRAFGADGVTPLAGAVVKVSSLTKIGTVLGATTDASGAFSIAGIPAGNFTIEAAHVATNSKVVLAGSIAAAGATVVQNLTLIPITQTTFATGAVKGQVFHAFDNTAAVGVAVFTDRGGLATTDASGSYEIDGLPAGPVTIRAIDQVRLEQGTIVTTVLGNTAVIANVLVVGGTGTVRGVVVGPNGQRVANAVVGGGLALVRTDANGAFELDDVPVGQRQISALDEPTQATASASVNLLNAGDVVNVELVLPGQGSIAGRVFEADGQTPMAQLTVILLGSVNTSTVTDANGGYRFDHLAVGAYQVSAFRSDFSDGNIAPSKVTFQGEVHTTNIVARGKGRVTGIVLAADGRTPLASHVGFTELRVKTGVLAPAGNSQCAPDIEVGDQTIELPKCQTVGIGFESALTRIIDTGVSGTFTFDNVFVGAFTVEAANGFSPAIIRAAGAIAHPGDTVPVVLQLQATSAVKGVVYQPDGVTPVGRNVVVAFSSATLGGDPNSPFTVTTNDAGEYLFPLVNPGPLTVTATDTVTGLSGQSNATVDAGATANAAIRLLGKSPVRVSVAGSNGPIAGAVVTVTRATFPNDSRQGRAGADGSILFGGGDMLTEGPFTVSAFDSASGISGFASGTVPRGGAEADVAVHLDDQAGSVHGRFLMPDGTTGIPNAQVHLTSARGDAFATTDPAGAFAVAGVFGAFTAEAFDPVTARRGRAQGSLTVNHDDVVANITAAAQGSVNGIVRFSKDSSPAAAADVTLFVNSAFSAQLLTSTGVDGSFTFPGVSAGALSIQARDPVTGISGSATGTIVNEGDVATVEIVLQVPLLGRVQGTVRRADGTPAIGAQVVISNGAQTTVDNDGHYAVDSVPVGAVRVNASAGTGFDGGFGAGDLKFDGDVATVDITFIGTGVVSATVRTADGGSVPFASVSLTSRNALQRSVAETTESDAQGSVRFAGIPVGDVSVTAVDNASGLAGSASGQLAADGSSLDLQILLQPAGAIRAHVLRQDKTTVAAGLAVELSGQSQRFGSTGADGSLSFDNLALGEYHAVITDPLGTGIAKATGVLTQAGQTLDLGTLFLDESPPRVQQIIPPNGVAGIPVTQRIQVAFSEPVDAATVTTATMPVSTPNGATPGSWTLSADGANATFAPLSPYADFSSVAVKVTTGVTDLVGKALAAEATSTFTTADSTPPAFVSRTPAPGTRDVGSTAVVRVAYSEAIDPSRFVGDAISVSLNGTQVAGRVDVTLSNTVIVFTPAAPLVPNATYTVRVQPAFDVYGNAQAAASSYTFATVDTIAPTIDALTSASGPSVKVGQTATITATVSAADVASVDLLVNGVVTQTIRSRPFVFGVSVTAALAPSFAVAVRAADLSGNIGPLQTLQISVEPDLPPAVSIVSPTDGTIVNSGSRVIVSVHAVDDIGVAQIGFQALGSGTATDALIVSPPVIARDATFQLDVPTDAPGGSKIDLRVAAIDSSGQSSPTSTVSLTVADTTAPVVHITSPAANAPLDAGQTVSVVVTAADAGSVSSISLAVSGAAVFSETRAVSPPQTSAQATFQVTVPGTARPTDQVVFSATALDAAGNTATAVTSTATIRDAVAPATTIAIDGGLSTIQRGRSFSVTVSATDDGGVAHFGYDTAGAFVLSGTQAVSPVQTTTSGRFTLTVPADAPIGAIVTITASAADGSGNVGRSAGATLTVVADAPPTVRITAPQAGATLVEGAAFALSADASDDVAIAKVEFRVNGVSVAVLTAPPYTSTQIVPAGSAGSSLLIEAVATDSANQTSRDAITLPLNVDATPPRLLTISPLDKATGVSIVTPIVATFSEPLNRATVTSGTFQVSVGGQLVPGSFAMSDGDTTVRFTAASPFPLNSTISITLTAGITDRFGNALADGSGNPLLQPLTFGFATGAFAITNPVSGANVLEKSRLTLEAHGSAWLGVATVTFVVNGTNVPATAGPGFTAALDVPPAASSSTLTIVAIARDGSGNQIASDRVTVNVVVGLTATPPIVGVPLGGAASVRVSVSSPLAGDLPVTFDAVDPTIIDLPAPIVIRAGQTSAAASVGGAAVGNTTLLAHSSHGVGSLVLSVSEAVSGQPLTPTAADVGLALSPAPLAAEVIGAPAAQSNVIVRVSANPAQSTTAVSVTSSDDSIARVVNVPVVQAGTEVAALNIATGRAGVAELTIRVGSEARTVLVVVGTAGDAQHLAGGSSPIGVSVAPAISAGQLFAPTGGRQTISVRILAAPAAADTVVNVTSSNPQVATVDGPVIVRKGQQVATITIVTGAAGTADVLLSAGSDVRALTVTSGTGAVPPFASAPAIGVAIAPAPSVGRVATPPTAQQTIGVRLLATAASTDVPVVASSTNSQVVRVLSASAIRAGALVSDLTFETGTAGVATITLRAGSEVRELTVVVGGDASIPTAPVVAPAIGVAVRPAPLAGVIISPVGGTALVGLRLLGAPAGSDIVAQVSSSNAAVANVPATVLIRAGDQVAQFGIVTPTAGVAEILVTAGAQTVGFTVISGTPPPGTVPIIMAPIVGVQIQK
jgi:hypothetical protein